MCPRSTLPVFPWPRRMQWGIWGAQGLVQGEREFKGTGNREVWERGDQHRHLLGLLCKPGPRQEPTVPNSVPWAGPTKGNKERGLPGVGSGPVTAKSRLLDQTNRKEENSSKMKSKICIYRMSSVSSAGCNPIIKIKILQQKTWLGTMVQTGSNYTVACGTRESL